MRAKLHLIAIPCVILLAGAGCESEAENGAKAEPARAAPSPAATEGGPTHVLVAFHSVTGLTERMAAAVTQGARKVDDVLVKMKAVAEVTPADLQRAHGVVIGGPTHFANIPGEMKTILDDWAWKHHVNLQDKVGGAFATGGTLTGGKEHVVVSLLLYMLNNRMVVVGPIVQPGDGGYGEVGATATTGAADNGLGPPELEGARRLGERVATAARRYRTSSR